MYYWWYPDWYAAFGHGTRPRPAADRHDETDASSSAATRFPADPDRRLERTVATALLGDHAVTGGDIDLSVQNGVVILDGEVDSEAVRCAVVARAWSVAGVTDVCNALTVKRHWFRP